jgi:hypothetical protein
MRYHAQWGRKERVLAMFSWFFCGLAVGVTGCAFVMLGAGQGIITAAACVILGILFCPIDFIRADFRSFAKEEARARLVTAEIVDDETVCVYVRNEEGGEDMVLCPRKRPEEKTA